MRFLILINKGFEIMDVKDFEKLMVREFGALDKLFKKHETYYHELTKKFSDTVNMHDYKKQCVDSKLNKLLSRIKGDAYLKDTFYGFIKRFIGTAEPSDDIVKNLLRENFGAYPKDILVRKMQDQAFRNQLIEGKLNISQFSKQIVNYLFVNTDDTFKDASPELRDFATWIKIIIEFIHFMEDYVGEIVSEVVVFGIISNCEKELLTESGEDVNLKTQIDGYRLSITESMTPVMKQLVNIPFNGIQRR